MNVDVLFASPWGALIIFFLRIIDVSCDTMRVIFAIRGKRAIAAALGFIQALVWIFAVGNAVKHLNSVLHVLGYAGGYAMGTYIGVSLEQAIAYGVATVRIVTKRAGIGIAAALREQGYGVTESQGVGGRRAARALDAAASASLTLADLAPGHRVARVATR
jgi:uncharacterized protein YebE (UPF0316 family)